MYECEIKKDKDQNVSSVFYNPLPVKAKLNTESKEIKATPRSSLVIPDCFFHVVNSLPFPPTPHLESSLQILSNEYIRFRATMVITSDALVEFYKPHENKMHTVYTFEKLKSEKTLEAVFAGAKDSATGLPPKKGDDYIKLFLKYAEENNIFSEGANLLKCIEKARDFVTSEHFLPYYLGNFARSQLLKMGVANEEIATVIEKKLSEHKSNGLSIIGVENAVLFSLMQQKTSESSGLLADSTWHPDMPCTKLIDIICERGHLVMGGFLGSHNYTGLPKSTIRDGKQIHYWPKTAAKKENSSIAHTIIVTGASKADPAIKGSQNLVYYIDPHHDQAKDPYPIYMMSYESFCERVGSIDGEHFATAKRAGMSTEGKSYTYYHPGLAPRLTNISSYAEPLAFLPVVSNAEKFETAPDIALVKEEFQFSKAVQKPELEQKAPEKDPLEKTPDTNKNSYFQPAFSESVDTKSKRWCGRNSEKQSEQEQENQQSSQNWCNLL